MRLKLVDGYASIIEQFQVSADNTAEKPEQSESDSTLLAKLEGLGDKCDGVRELIASKENALKSGYNQAIFDLSNFCYQFCKLQEFCVFLTTAQ
jgi:hypothetical protein